jgi:hypothetical protein
MFPTSNEARSRIDDFLPVYDFSADYDIRIDAAASVVYECLLRADFHELWVVRLLMSLRTGRRIPRNQNSGGIRRCLQGTGFVLLADVPEKEIVLGVAGKFWRVDGGRCLDLAADGFTEFSPHGYAKAAGDFRLNPESSRSTVLSTETRIQCFGAEALWKFHAYWSFVGPFSGLIRKAILQQVKGKAESVQKGEPQNQANPQPATTANP